MHKHLPNLYVFLDRYNNQIFKNINTNVGIIYRNYDAPKRKREAELIKIAKICRKKRHKLFVSNDIKLTIKTKADGVYIPSFNKTKNFSNLENKKLIILGSAHNQKEIKEKIFQKCSAIFLSPVFCIQKSKKFLDIHKFNIISRSNKINILALGGITKHNMRKVKLLHVQGFGGIRIFKKKPAFKRPVF
jgi:thiamine-phosphate pyrophosphorylase